MIPGAVSAAVLTAVSYTTAHAEAPTGVASRDGNGATLSVDAAYAALRSSVYM